MAKAPAARRLPAAALLAGLVFIFLGVFNTIPFTDRAQAYTQDIATTAGVTYASLRGINAAISFVEEIEVGASVVVSGSINPFKFLEPLDDAVERLSSVIFFVAGAAAILSVLLATIGQASFVLIGASVSLSALMKLARASAFSQPVERLLSRMFQLGLMGVLIVLAFAISSVIGERMSDQSWDRYNAILDTAGAAGDTLETTGGGLTETADSIEKAREVVMMLVANSDELIRAIIGVFASYMFKTLVLPVLLAFSLMWVLRRPLA